MINKFLNFLFKSCSAGAIVGGVGGFSYGFYDSARLHRNGYYIKDETTRYGENFLQFTGRTMSCSVATSAIGVVGLGLWPITILGGGIYYKLNNQPEN